MFRKRGEKLKKKKSALKCSCKVFKIFNNIFSCGSSWYFLNHSNVALKLFKPGYRCLYSWQLYHVNHQSPKCSKKYIMTSKYERFKTINVVSSDDLLNGEHKNTLLIFATHFDPLNAIFFNYANFAIELNWM